MNNAWMVRSSGGDLFELFEGGVVAIGFETPLDLTGLDREQIKEHYSNNNPEYSRYKVGGAVGMLDRIVNKMKTGDPIITYDPSSRTYLIGKISSDYIFDHGKDPYFHLRKVTWESKRVSRDDLKPATRNSLGSTLTVFRLTEEMWADLESSLKGESNPAQDEEESEDIIEEKRNLQENARERLKDRIVSLGSGEMEELLATLLRAMGFKATVSPVGPDRGVDVIASPDGLGLQEPRIKAEVKHRKKTQMSPHDIRGFIGALRAGDRGIFLSTGGFTREARYEAERATIPVTLLDLDGLARLIETHYDNFDTEGRTLLPLTRILWPVD